MARLEQIIWSDDQVFFSFVPPHFSQFIPSFAAAVQQPWVQAEPEAMAFSQQAPAFPAGLAGLSSARAKPANARDKIAREMLTLSVFIMMCWDNGCRLFDKVDNGQACTRQFCSRLRSSHPCVTRLLAGTKFGGNFFFKLIGWGSCRGKVLDWPRG